MPSLPINRGLPPQPSLRLFDLQAPFAPDTAAVQTAYALNQLADFNLDGDPSRLSWAEFTAALHHPNLRPEVRATLLRLHPYFYQDATAVAPPSVAQPFKRRLVRLPQGGSVELPAGNLVLAATVLQVVAGLATEPRFASLFARVRIMVSPVGHGLDRLPEFGADFAQSEGCAMAEGTDAEHQVPTAAITGDSLMMWQVGLAHELIHLVHQELSASERAEVQAAWATLTASAVDLDGYANPDEMLAFFGQYYLAGFGAEVQQVVPELYPLLVKYLGTATIQPGPLETKAVRAKLAELRRWFVQGGCFPSA